MTGVRKKKESVTLKKKAAKPKLTKVNESEETKERVKKVTKKVNEYKSHKVTTIDDILSERAKKINMKGNEILNNEQIKILLTQIALGNAEDGLTGLPPTTAERMSAAKMIVDMSKSDIGEEAIEEHNTTIQEFQLKNDDGEAPDRQLGEFE